MLVNRPNPCVVWALTPTALSAATKRFSVCTFFTTTPRPPALPTARRSISSLLAVRRCEPSGAGGGGTGKKIHRKSLGTSTHGCGRERPHFQGKRYTHLISDCILTFRNCFPQPNLYPLKLTFFKFFFVIFYICNRELDEQHVYKKSMPKC